MLKLFADLRKVPVLRALFPFVFGILISDGAKYVSVLLLLSAGILLFLIAFVLIREKKVSRSVYADICFGGAILVFFLLMGILYSHAKLIQEHSDYHTKQSLVVGRLMDGPVEKEHFVQVHLKASHCLFGDSLIEFTQNVVVYLEKDSLPVQMMPGEEWTFGGEFRKIQNRGNPGEFDYQGYMLRKNFNYTIFVASRDNCLKNEKSREELRYLPAKIRQKIISSWDSEDHDIAILSALTLGYKSFLDKETKDSFADAGAMHLLAVSGLHVGMIWWILDLLIRIPRHSVFFRTFKLILILGILWFYAGITGFSDSVSRSVSMFSLVAFSSAIQRKSTIFNTLLLSAFLLLLLKPSRISEPGFQLSYIAVFGIVTIQPMIKTFYKGRSKAVNWLMDLISVSIAAQLSTLPLVLLYFHQFPLWFLLTNIVAIPLVSVILALFVVFSPCLIFFPEYQVFIRILDALVHILNYLIQGISSLPYAVVENIPLQSELAFLMLLLTASVIAFLFYKNIDFFLSTLLLSILLFVASIYFKQEQRGEKYLEVFNFRNSTIVSAFQNFERSSYIWNHFEEQDPYLDDFIVSLSRIPGKIHEHRIHSISSDSCVSDSSYCFLAEGLYAMNIDGISVLSGGECSLKALQCAFEDFDWDILIMARGFPLKADSTILATKKVKVVADGTLRSFEQKILTKNFSKVNNIAEQGTFRLEIY